MSTGSSNPTAGADAATPIDAETATRPLIPNTSGERKSIHIDIGWTFSSGIPVGTYELRFNGQTFTSSLNGGHIRIDEKLRSLAGTGDLTIRITDGPVFTADVSLGMPPIQSPQGLAQRLTNLGFYAGTDGGFDGRGLWAIRAFKRAQMNGFTRHSSELENNVATQAFLTAVQSAHGAYPNDSITGALALPALSRAFAHAACSARAPMAVAPSTWRAVPTMPTRAMSATMVSGKGPARVA